MELRDTPGNYRPVSLTSRVGKVLKNRCKRRSGREPRTARLGYGAPGPPVSPKGKVMT